MTCKIYPIIVSYPNPNHFSMLKEKTKRNAMLLLLLGFSNLYTSDLNYSFTHDTKLLISCFHIRPTLFYNYLEMLWRI